MVPRNDDALSRLLRWSASLLDARACGVVWRQLADGPCASVLASIVTASVTGIDPPQALWRQRMFVCLCAFCFVYFVV